MRNLWDGLSDERFWCEITDGTEIGGDLQCPKLTRAAVGAAPTTSSMRSGRVTSFSTTSHLRNYSSVRPWLVARSEERPIAWVPHGTVGRAKRVERTPLP